MEVVGESEPGVFNVAFTQTPLKEIVPIKQTFSGLLKSYDSKVSQLQYKTMPFDAECKEKLTLKGVYDLKTLYFSYPKYEEELEQLMESVQSAAENAKEFQGVIAQNEPCLAMDYYGDWNWYRAKVLSVLSKNEYSVEFVDYGIHGEVQYSDIRRIPNYLMDIPKYTFKCCLWKYPVLEIPSNIINEFAYDALEVDFEVELIKSEHEPWDAFVTFIDRKGAGLIEECIKKSKVIDRLGVALLSTLSANSQLSYEYS